MDQTRMQRGAILFHQRRYELAETEMRATLAADPNDAQAHGLLALCLIEQGRYREAGEEAGHTLRLAAGAARSYYILAYIQYKRQRLNEAHQAVTQAIALDPDDADCHALCAQIHLDWRDWTAALSAAERGLQIDPEHGVCTNLRAAALVQLGRRADAGRTIEAALARDPEDAMTHANRGWALLHEGRHRQAMEHFREALRLEPDMDWARTGIVEALKARHLVYRWMLMYFLWLSRLSPGAQWGLILGGWLGSRLLLSVSDATPPLRPLITPIIYAYAGFVLMTWLAVPLFNLLLRLNRFGRMTLSREQTWASNLIGGLLGTALLCAIAALATDHADWVQIALVTALLTLPVAGTFSCPNGWPRWTMAAATAFLAFAGAMAVASSIRASLFPEDLKRALMMLKHAAVWRDCFIFGILASSIGANLLMSARVKR